MFISDSDRWHVLLLPDSVFYNVQTAIYALFFLKLEHSMAHMTPTGCSKPKFLCLMEVVTIVCGLY